MFGAILPQDWTLEIGKKYYLHFVMPSIATAAFKTDKDLMNKFNYFLAPEYGNVTYVDTAIGYRDLYMTVAPTKRRSLRDWINTGFTYTFNQMNMSGTQFVSASDTMADPEKPIWEKLGAGTGRTIAETIKPLVPYVLIGGAVWIAVGNLTKRSN